MHKVNDNLATFDEKDFYGVVMILYCSSPSTNVTFKFANGNEVCASEHRVVSRLIDEHPISVRIETPVFLVTINSDGTMTGPGVTYVCEGMSNSIFIPTAHPVEYKEWISTAAFALNPNNDRCALVTYDDGETNYVRPSELVKSRRKISKAVIRGFYGGSYVECFTHSGNNGIAYFGDNDIAANIIRSGTSKSEAVFSITDGALYGYFLTKDVLGHKLLQDFEDVGYDVRSMSNLPYAVQVDEATFAEHEQREGAESFEYNTHENTLTVIRQDGVLGVINDPRHLTATEILRAIRGFV